jgi:hypothetical protein
MPVSRWGGLYFALVSSVLVYSFGVGTTEKCPDVDVEHVVEHVRFLPFFSHFSALLALSFS